MQCSVARHSRMIEKVELQNLNDRLASYIDRVRFLENENSHLGQKVKHSFVSHLDPFLFNLYEKKTLYSGSKPHGIAQSREN